ncbi:MAG: hypothetical protein L3J39_17370 [Verrucomicrobiales bacterium]|nr:hypothetical protein [Verrucomicrobiales bacterium]
MYELYASNNQIVDIKPVCDLPKLASLYLDDNKIVDLTGIGKLNKVWSFGLKGNQIANLAPLKGIQPMSFLFLEGNKVSDLQPLVDLLKADLKGAKRFSPYVRIYLKGNALENTKAKVQIAEMKKLGVRLADVK